MTQASRVRLGPFLAGLLVGFLALFVVALALRNGAYRSARFNVELWVHGAEATRHGATLVEVADDNGWQWAQRCREECDDVQLSLSTTDNAFDVTVRNSQGQVISGPASAYVTSGLGAGVTRWTVGGDAPFGIRLSRLDRDTRGRVRERVHTPGVVDRPSVETP